MTVWTSYCIKTDFRVVDWQVLNIAQAAEWWQNVASLREHTHSLKLLLHVCSMRILMVVLNRQNEEADDAIYLKEARKRLLVVTFDCDWGEWSPVSHRVGRVSIARLSMWNVWWRKRLWWEGEQRFTEHFDIPLPISIPSTLHTHR